MKCLTIKMANNKQPKKVLVKFSIPYRTGLVAGQFFITTVGAGVTFSVSCNGYFTSIL